MSTVMGLSFFFHDSAAALVRDGRPVAAAAEERFCRRKHTNEFPRRAIEYCLEAGELNSINDLEAIVFYEKPILKFNRILETLVAVWPRGLVNFARRLPVFLSTKFNVYRTIERMLPGYQGQILFAEHHMSHAAAAYYCSPYDEAAILTIDGVGEWETTTIGVGRGQQIHLDRAIHFPHSIGLLYSALTSYLGFRVNDGEWKVMGLAPYGEPKYVDQFRRLVSIKPDGSFRLNMEYFVHHYSSRWTAHRRRWERLFGLPQRHPSEDIEQHHEDLARSGQAVVEEMILNLAREARRKSDCPNLVIAGGVGLNSVANWKIEQEGVFDNVWIQPAAGDDGGALGAALYVSQQILNESPTPEMTDAFLGPEFSSEEIEAYVKLKEIPYERLDEDSLVERAADLITEGKVVGWFDGRMEFGPRALGSRSILADARDPKMKATINRKIKYREYFRPFAPAVLQERVHDFFDVPPNTKLPFMLKVPQVRPEKRSEIPAVTHEDGTGRVQTVTEKGNSRYYRLLKEFDRRTGVPVILNTSFNIRGEPVVCTPDDAYKCFIETGIDALVIGNCLLTEKPHGETIDHEKGFEKSDRLEEQIGKEPDPEETLRATIMSPTLSGDAAVQEQVLNFYKELPFNYYSNAVDTAIELSRANQVAEYAALDKYLKHANGIRAMDVGCGAGWFVNSCAHYYGIPVVGMDLNPVVLKQARSVARLMSGCERAKFIEANVFEYQCEEPFDVVNSLGVLHHTPDCHGAICCLLDWIKPEGYLHLGLYHKYGRRPFLDHFDKMRDEGASETELYEEFRRLNPDIADPTHVLSWFRDQVLHPHETQHTYEEISELLDAEGFVIEATSINRFQPLLPRDELIVLERQLAHASQDALYRKGRYFPGFFVLWARNARSSANDG